MHDACGVIGGAPGHQPGKAPLAAWQGMAPGHQPGKALPAQGLASVVSILNHPWQGKVSVVTKGGKTSLAHGEEVRWYRHGEEAWAQCMLQVACLCNVLCWQVWL